MRALSVCVLLCCALAFASAAKPGPALFSDWLEEQTTVAGPASTAKPAAASSPAYEEADYEWGCLTETKVDNCRCIGCKDVCADDCDNAPTCCSTYYSESTLGCCEEKEYDHYNREEVPSFMTNMEIGTCEFTEFLFDDPVVVTTDTVFKMGTFSAVCNVHRGGHCGHPFCDSMVLSWEGTTYKTVAVSKTNDTAPPQIGTCSPAEDGPRIGHLRRSHRTGGSKSAAKPAPAKAAKPAPAKAAKPAPAKATKPAPAKATKPAPQKAKKADAAEVEYYHHDEEPTTYYKGNAYLFSGPATVSSRKYNLKYRTGFIDLAFNLEDTVTVTAAEAAGLHLVTPYKYILKFNKEEHY